LSGAVALSKPYSCVFGAPVLQAVDPRIFSLRYFARCMDCTFCGDDCCSYGVDIDAENAARVAALPGLQDVVRVPPSDWFTATPTPDAEFPSGAYVRTQAKDGKCVFHMMGGRGCAIHAYCLREGLDYHLYKPMVSTLFPVTFDNGLLCASSEAIDGSLVCSNRGDALYDGAREELRYYFGDGLVDELDALRASLNAVMQEPRIASSALPA
jgi:hypothetical protein